MFNRRTEDWQAGVRELTQGQGVPVVYDSIGKDTFLQSLECLAVRGALVLFGNASGPVTEFNPMLLMKGSNVLMRPTMWHFLRTRAELQTAASELFTAIASGAIKVPVHQRFALADAGKAHHSLQSRLTTGATILIP